MAAEAEAVGKSAIDAHDARRVGNIVQIAGRIGSFVIDRRVHYPVLDGEHADNQLNAPAGA